jgi:hypothetical protein
MEDSKTLFSSSKFPEGTLKNFSKMYTQFGHAPSKMLSSPALVFGLDDMDFVSR